MSIFIFAFVLYLTLSNWDASASKIKTAGLHCWCRSKTKTQARKSTEALFNGNCQKKWLMKKWNKFVSTSEARVGSDHSENSPVLIHKRYQQSQHPQQRHQFQQHQFQQLRWNWLLQKLSDVILKTWLQIALSFQRLRKKSEKPDAQKYSTNWTETTFKN